MKIFFLILFFSEVIALTSEPIDIIGHINFDLTEPISAITSGAHISIDVTNDVSGIIDSSNILTILDSIREKFPAGSITATLIGNNGERIILDWVSGSTDGKETDLTLSSSVGVPTGIEFSKVEIDSSIKLIGVTVIWINYSK